MTSALLCTADRRIMTGNSCCGSQQLTHRRLGGPRCRNPTRSDRRTLFTALVPITRSDRRPAGKRAHSGDSRPQEKSAGGSQCPLNRDLHYAAHTLTCVERFPKLWEQTIPSRQLLGGKENLTEKHKHNKFHQNRMNIFPKKSSWIENILNLMKDRDQKLAILGLDFSYFS